MTDVLFAVVAAHRFGQPLHPQLLALGARFVRCAPTAPVYRLLALPGAGVARGGIVRASTGGAVVEVELHALPRPAVEVLAGTLPAPLTVGLVELTGAVPVTGILCASRPAGAVDITGYGSWPAYLADTAAAAAVGRGRPAAPG